jgi:hypothetical protein
MRFAGLKESKQHVCWLFLILVFNAEGKVVPDG